MVQPQLRIGGSIGIQRDQSKAYLPLSTFSAFARASLHLGRDSSGALLVGTRDDAQSIRMPAVTSGYGVGECASPG